MNGVDEWRPKEVPSPIKKGKIDLMHEASVSKDESADDSHKWPAVTVEKIKLNLLDES